MGYPTRFSKEPDNLIHYIKCLDRGNSLSQLDTLAAFRLIMAGDESPVQIATFLTLLRSKGEVVEEVTGAATAIRSYAAHINAPANAMDVCGTGGDNLGTLNISTAVAFVVAACGIPVAKHGNKAVSSQSGSADVLMHLGVKVDADTPLIEKSLAEANLCFMMAPKFHTAMRHVAPIRKEMGIRTIFNLVGPLCNPADVKYQLMGVYDKKWVRPIAYVLQSLGSESAWVVHGSDGLDELTTSGVSYVAELAEGVIREFEVTPEQSGLTRVTIDELKGGDGAYNADRLKQLLEGKRDAYRDIVLLNAAAALIVSGKADNLKQGINIAEQHIDNKAAMAVLDKLIMITNAA